VEPDNIEKNQSFFTDIEEHWKEKYFHIISFLCHDNGLLFECREINFREECFFIVQEEFSLHYIRNKIYALKGATLLDICLSDCWLDGCSPLSSSKNEFTFQ
jgi:hypothetical protein